MTLLENSRSADRRIAVIGLDGTPYSFLKKEIEAGNLPNLERLTSRGNFVQMESEIPTISSVAWASFMTGKNPAEHGIFGFTDRKPGTYELYFPNYSHLKEEPIWDILSREGKRCCVINVPSTYPARPLNGVMVSGFVAPNLERATYPAEALAYLNRIDYRIDVDASKGRESLDLLLEDLHLTLEKRREAMLHFWEEENWDFFMCVFTGTDRLHHFMWKHYEREDTTYKPEFMKYYSRLDEIIGEFMELLSDDTALFMLSDHGFCSIEKEVYLNHYLAEEGLLAFSNPEPRTIADIDPMRTRVYCMDPGRLYLNLSGREPGGIVNPGKEADNLLDKLRRDLQDLEIPETGEKPVARIVSSSEIYSGPCIGDAPDLVAVPKRGYDFKGTVARNQLAGNSALNGMHTEDDAMAWIEGNDEPLSLHIRDLGAIILKAF